MKLRLILYFVIFTLCIPGLSVAQLTTSDSNKNEVLLNNIDSAQRLMTEKISSSALTSVKSFSPVMDTELIQGRIMLTDATLDLNRTLLQGIQASLDSFNVKSKKVVDEKNIQATIRSMQRNRDKVLLTPFLLHMQDSLKSEIKKEEIEKAGLETLLYGSSVNPLAGGELRDTIKTVTGIISLVNPKDTTGRDTILKTNSNQQKSLAKAPNIIDTVITTLTNNSSGTEKDTVLKDTVIITSLSVTNKPDTGNVKKDSVNHPVSVQNLKNQGSDVALQVSETILKDTILKDIPQSGVAKTSVQTTGPTVYDTIAYRVQSVEIKKADETSSRVSIENRSPIKAELSHENLINFDSLHIRPVIEGISNPESTNSIQSVHFETARAIYEEDTTDEERAIHETIDTQSVQNSHDSIGYVPSANNGVSENTQIISDSLRRIKAQLYLTRALKANNDKNYKTAAEDLKKSLDLLPGYYDAWFSLGDVEAHLGYYTKALNEYKRCAQIDSSKSNLFYKIGSIQMKLKQRDEAGTSFTKALQIDSNSVQAMMGLATIYRFKKQYKTAITEYNRILRVDRGYHLAYRARAMAEYHLKRYEAAIDDFTRFLIFDESDASVYYFRGLSKIARNEQMDGCADLSFAAKLGYPAALKATQNHCN